MKTENEDKTSDNPESNFSHSMSIGSKNTLDETLLNVFIIDEGREFSRPQMVILLDEFSREILGFRLKP